MTKIRFGGASLNQIPLNWENNTKNILEAVLQANEKNVELLVLPELCITGYGVQDLFFHSWVIDKSLSILIQLAPKCKGLMVTLGLPLIVNSELYNGVAIIDDGELKGITLKQNLANDGVHYEKRWFKEWKRGAISELVIGKEKIQVGDLRYDIKGHSLGIEICEDAWREDRPACVMYEEGINIIINSSASHFAFGKTKFREKLFRDSSAKFNCTYIFTNLLGNESGRMIFDGDVLIASKGKLLQKSKVLTFHKVNLIYCDVDPKENNPVSNLLEDEFDKNEMFVQAVSLGLYDYMRKSGVKGFALSLSGGADSAACAVLVREMVRRGVLELGFQPFAESIKIQAANEDELMSKILFCAYQATDNSSKSTFEAAETLANSLHANFSQWSVQSEVTSIKEKIEGSIQRKLSWESDDIALQNIQARMRNPGIWMLANIKGCILLTTSNRSEGDVGYATMDGDTAGSLAPIAGVDKSFIRSFLKWAEVELKYSALGLVNNLQPTAELRPGNTQTDEDDLMPYDLMVEIERLVVKEGYSPVQVYKTIIAKGKFQKQNLKKYIFTFYRLLSINQWKRERIAPSFHLDDFNIDPKTWFRFPILSGNYKEELEDLASL